MDILLLIVLSICVITDLKSRKIYNKVIYPSLLLAFLINGIQFGWTGLSNSLLGFVTGLAILLIPYLMGGMGAGDVKLLALVGAFKGSAFVVYAAVYMGIVGGLIALILFVSKKGFLTRLKVIIYSLCGIRYGMKKEFLKTSVAMKETFPYGVAIAAGSILAFLLNGVALL